jgi:hypothetical protein
MITKPGIYDLPSDDYHADPAETPSLSAGMINDILSAPAKCRENSRRLNPDYEEPEGQERFTIGSVSHVMFLEPALFSSKVAVCLFDDWRTKDAKAMRDQARDSGKTPILSKHMAKIESARRQFYASPFVRSAFEDGVFERSLFWRHPTLGFWCRARPDFLANSLSHTNDYKATANANPADFGRHAFAMGYHRRAAWYLDGIEAVTGERPRHYWFINQEVRAPYLVSVVELDWNALEAGRADNERAAELFAKCLERNDWPGYRHPDSPDNDRAFQVGLPNYAYMRMEGSI